MCAEPITGTGTSEDTFNLLDIRREGRTSVKGILEIQPGYPDP